MFILKKRSNAKRKGGVEECLQRIELEANDDLRMVLDFGPQHFTTHELHGMLRKLNEQSRYILRLRDRLLPSILLLFIVPAIVLFGTLKWKSLLYGVFFGIPMTLLLLIGAAIYLTKKYPTLKDAPYLDKMIHQELERRRKDASIF